MVFGITGGSGSGKSTVSAMLDGMGVYIIDTDKIARQVTEKDSECLNELCKAFGDGILLLPGRLDRKKLASIAFADKEKTALLSHITHKHIKAETEKLIAACNATLIGIDGAVIIGSPLEGMCEKMVLVTADRDLRLVRIMERDNLSRVEAVKRLNAQPTDDFYRQRCDYVIDNSGGTEILREQVTGLYNKLKGV